MSLAFLSTREDVVAQSPLAASTATAGATFESRAGWQVAVRFAPAPIEALACRERVGWADVSHLRKLELQGPAAALAEFGAMPAPGDGLAVREDDAWWCRVTPQHALVLGGTGVPADGDGVRALDVTSQLAALRIGGPLARELFARFCALDLRPHVAPPGALRPGSVARTPGFVLCEAPNRYLMLFGAAYGAYVWEVVADAGVRLGGRPVGVDALRATEAPSHA